MLNFLIKKQRIFNEYIVSNTDQLISDIDIQVVTGLGPKNQ